MVYCATTIAASAPCSSSLLSNAVVLLATHFGMHMAPSRQSLPSLCTDASCSLAFLLLSGCLSLQVQTALYAFDMLQKLDDIQKVNCNSAEFDKQLCTNIFVADLVENKLGVDWSKLDTPAPPTAPEPAPQPAPPEHNQASHDEVPINLDTEYLPPVCCTLIVSLPT